MRKLILLIPFVVGFTSTKEYYTATPIIKLQPKEIEIEEVVPKPDLVEVTGVVDLAPLIEAMIWVESRDNDSAYNKREDAVGCLQIRPIMLRECNRILELQNVEKRYTLQDRWSRTKSVQIFYVVNNYHHENATYEEIARAWNGGPNWAQKGGTKRYWNKVQRKLKKESKKDEHSDNRFTEI